MGKQKFLGQEVLKRTPKKKEKGREKKRRTQVFEGIVIATKPIRSYDIFFPPKKFTNFERLSEDGIITHLEGPRLQIADSSLVERNASRPANYKEKIYLFYIFYSLF